MGVKMGGRWVLRCLLSGLHLGGGVAACGSLVATLVRWSHNMDCLPPVTDVFGDPVSVKEALGGVCDVVVYSSGAVCALNLLMAVTLHCCTGRWGCCLVQQILTLMTCLLTTGGGAALTVDFILWCQSLQHHLPAAAGCERAARMYDSLHQSSNMTAYFDRMELQQACQWAAVPFTLCAVIVYSLVMKAETQPQDGRHQPQGGRYYFLPDDESAPLMVQETRLGARVPSEGTSNNNS